MNWNRTGYSNLPTIFCKNVFLGVRETHSMETWGKDSLRDTHKFQCVMVLSIERERDS